MRAFQIFAIQPKKIIFENKTNTVWYRIKKSITSTEKINLGRWEHREDEKQKAIKSIWANSDHCGDHICGQPEVIREITKIRKN